LNIYSCSKNESCRVCTGIFQAQSRKQLVSDLDELVTGVWCKECTVKGENMLKEWCNCHVFILTGHELEVQQIGKTTDESSYMIGRFNTDTDTDVTVQLFGQEIMNLRKREAVERRQNKRLLGNRR
jgi:hypothetical protein